MPENARTCSPWLVTTAVNSVAITTAIETRFTTSAKMLKGARFVSERIHASNNCHSKFAGLNSLHFFCCNCST
jgi:hypothetical protein